MSRLCFSEDDIIGDVVDLIEEIKAKVAQIIDDSIESDTTEDFTTLHTTTPTSEEDDIEDLIKQIRAELSKMSDGTTRDAGKPEMKTQTTQADEECYCAANRFYQKFQEDLDFIISKHFADKQHTMTARQRVQSRRTIKSIATVDMKKKHDSDAGKHKLDDEDQKSLYKKSLDFKVCESDDWDRQDWDRQDWDRKSKARKNKLDRKSLDGKKRKSTKRAKSCDIRKTFDKIALDGALKKRDYKSLDVFNLDDTQKKSSISSEASSRDKYLDAKNLDKRDTTSLHAKRKKPVTRSKSGHISRKKPVKPRKETKSLDTILQRKRSKSSDILSVQRSSITESLDTFKRSKSSDMISREGPHLREKKRFLKPKQSTYSRHVPRSAKAHKRKRKLHRSKSLDFDFPDFPSLETRPPKKKKKHISSKDTKSLTCLYAKYKPDYLTKSYDDICCKCMSLHTDIYGREPVFFAEDHSEYKFPSRFECSICREEDKFPHLSITEQAQFYLEQRNIDDLFKFLGAHLTAAQPENPIEFLINLLEQCIDYRKTNCEPPLLFKVKHIESLFRSFDPMGFGEITLDQYNTGLYTLGLKKKDEVLIKPKLNEEVYKISKEVFIADAHQLLKVELNKIIHVPGTAWEPLEPVEHKTKLLSSDIPLTRSG